MHRAVALVASVGLVDEVDRLVLAWGRERPELDVSPMEILSRITRLARHLDRERSAAFAAHGLEIWEFDVLAALRGEVPHRPDLDVQTALRTAWEGGYAAGEDHISACCGCSGMGEPPVNPYGER